MTSDGVQRQGSVDRRCRQAWWIIAPASLCRPLATALVGCLLALVMFAVGAFAGGLGGASVASAQGLAGVQTRAALTPQHALPVREIPAADAILQAPPTRVQMWFSEDLNPLTSRLVVIDTTNHEVDLGDSQVSATNTREMTVSLPLIHAGTYVVVWRTQSADDGHVVSGSYIFRIARPDGSVPPVPAVLPTSHIIGGGQALATGTLDGPTILQTIMTWLALTLMTFWVGGLIWETWILAPGRQRDRDLAAASALAAARFRRLAPYALGVLLLADVGIIMAQSAEIAGAWAGAFSPVLLRAIVFGSRYGEFWWLRQVVALAALALTLLAGRRALRVPVASSAWLLSEGEAPSDEAPSDEAPDVAGGAHAQAPGVGGDASGDIPDWRREVALALRGIPRLPRRLAQGVRARSGEGRLQLLLGAALIVAFAFSGHAAAVSASVFWYAISVDLFHITATAAWLGGLLYIAAVLIPALRRLTARQRARVLALGLPEFGALALLAALLLAATGSLNTTFHLTSLSQFLTTTYGRTLTVKIELFLLMAAISAYHAFFLRPRLARELAATSPDAQPSKASLIGDGRGDTRGDTRGRSPARRTNETARRARPASEGGALALAAHAGAPGGATARLALGATQPVGAISDERRAPQHAQADDATPTTDPSAAPDDADTPTPTVARLARSLAEWLQREALLGVGVLLCVALLGAFAGSLYSQPLPPTTRSSGAFVQTQPAGGYHVTLRVTPDTFGTNTFTVTVTNSQGQAVSGAAVLIQTSDLDMDMGTQSAQLKEIGASAPGAYATQADLTMAGHWQITVKVLPPNSQQFVITTFKLIVGYQ
ncbi:MAG TPA: copper resistance protein CopC [Ktedonobacterales bacterium]|nr:copper resistance protein CopC [Ktedonobacterales bacterium]